MIIVGPVSYRERRTDLLRSRRPSRTTPDRSIGVISGTASLDALQSIVASATIGNTGYLYLVDQNGDVIAGGGSAAAGGSLAGRHRQLHYGADADCSKGDRRHGRAHVGDADAIQKYFWKKRRRGRGIAPRERAILGTRCGVADVGGGRGHECAASA